MKKIKRIFGVIVAIILIVIVAQQFYYYFHFKGNLQVLIAYQFMPSSTSYELYLDGEKIKEGYLTSQYTGYLPFKTTPGNHAIMIKINEDVSKEIKFNTFLVTFILIDYTGVSPFDEDDEERISISIQKHHLFFLS